MVIFKNPRDAGQIDYLGRQIRPNDPKFLSYVFEEATQQPYSYLFLNFRSETPIVLRIMSNVLKTDQNPSKNKHLSIYVPYSEKENARKELVGLQTCTEARVI